MEYFATLNEFHKFIPLSIKTVEGKAVIFLILSCVIALFADRLNYVHWLNGKE